MFRKRAWLVRGTTRGIVGSCSMLMVLSGCDPQTRDVLLGGLQTAADGLLQVFADLASTAISALFTRISQNTEDANVVVQAVFGWVDHMAC